ncbi:helix-turn-helix transcriptional regulator, partial [Pseudomonas aeruginosa]
MELKDRIKAARKHAKLTQAQLAQRVGLDQTSISNLEQGKTQ